MIFAHILKVLVSFLGEVPIHPLCLLKNLLRGSERLGISGGEFDWLVIEGKLGHTQPALLALEELGA